MLSGFVLDEHLRRRLWRAIQTHNYLAEHLQNGHHSPGIFLVRLKSKPAEVIEYLVLANYASDPSEWRDWINFIP